MKRNDEIDRLRALAVVATIYAHVSDLWLWKVPLISFMQRYITGINGVLLFFTISGFVISASLIPKVDAALERNNSVFRVLAAFFCKRLYRITPTSVLWILFTLSILIVTEPAQIQGNVYAACAALFNCFNVYTAISSALPNSFGVYWSLSLEEQFYISLPILLILFNTATKRIVALTGIMLLTNFGIGKFCNVFPTFPIVCGVVLYILDRRFNLIEQTRVSLLSSRIILVPLALLLTIAIISSATLPYRHILIGIPSMLLVFVAAIGKNTVLPVKKGLAIIGWLGSRSFTLYLSHLPMIFIIRHCWINIGPYLGFQYSYRHNLAIFVTWLIATIAISELSFRLVEKRFTEKGRSIADNIELGKIKFNLNENKSGLTSTSNV